MDRLDTDTSSRTARDTLLPVPRHQTRTISLEDLPLPPEPGTDLAGHTGSGWKVRLDAGHHRSRSRWLGRESPQPRDRVGPLGADLDHASVLVASRGARLLAAMVRAILGDRAGGDAPPHPGRSCVATIGGPRSADPIGVVRVWPLGSSLDYLLIHAQADGEPALGGASVPPGLAERYSLEPGADWWAGDVKGQSGRYRFRAYQQGNFRAEIRLQAPGAHHILPALAALAIGLRMDVSARQIKDRLEEFPGVPRGFESRGTFRGATLVDDEATESGGVGGALGLAREVFGGRTIWAVYLPDPTRGPGPPADPREFLEANHLILVDPSPLGAESTRLLAASLRSSGTSVVLCSSLERATRELDRGLEPGDVLVTLGAGEVGTIADAFLRRLSRDRHG